MAPAHKRSPFRLSATTAQARDTGMALTLVCLLVALLADKRPFLTAGILLLVTDMTLPALFKPAAVLWLGLSQLLGAVMSRVLLSVIFLTVVTPVALVRRMLGKDAMQMRKWKKDATSVFRVREHTFTARDIETPY